MKNQNLIAELRKELAQEHNWKQQEAFWEEQQRFWRQEIIVKWAAISAIIVTATIKLF